VHKKEKEGLMMWRRARGPLEGRPGRRERSTKDARDNRCKVSPCDHMKAIATRFLFFSFLVVDFFLPPLFKTTEGVVVGFQIFACAPK
jgi:hypothetical protein